MAVAFVVVAQLAPLYEILWAFISLVISFF